jgi:hypothetical protein
VPSPLQLLPSSWFSPLAMAVDLVHALSMITWGLGLPLLIWHGLPRLSRAYMWYSLAFIVITLLSHWLLGECVLTTLARFFWEAAGGARDRVPFTVLFVNAVAGIRPSSRSAVLIWEFAVLVSSAGSLWYWYRSRPRRRPKSERFEMS